MGGYVMAAYAKKLSKKWIQKHAFFVVLKDTKSVEKSKRHHLVRGMNFALHYLLQARRVQNVAPGQQQQVDPVSIQLLGLVK